MVNKWKSAVGLDQDGMIINHIYLDASKVKTIELHLTEEIEQCYSVNNNVKMNIMGKEAFLLKLAYEN